MSQTTTTGKGAMIFWDAATVSREGLQEKFRELSLSKFLPQGRTELGTLFDSLKTLYPEKKGYLVRPLDNAGYELVLEKKGEEKNSREHVASFLLGPAQSVIMTNRDDMVLSHVNETFRSLLLYYTPTDVTRCLKNLIMSIPHGLGGTSLRKAGGIYWLQEHAMKTFRQVSTAMEQISNMKIYHVNHELGEKEKQAVLEGIVDELKVRIDSIRNEVYRGELGNAGLENKLTLLEHIEHKAKDYEDLLDTSLTKTRALITAARTSISSAILMMDTQQETTLV